MVKCIKGRAYKLIDHNSKIYTSNFVYPNVTHLDAHLLHEKLYTKEGLFYETKSTL